MPDPAEAARWMERAIVLSKRGFPAPNPPVGCVIVKDGEVVGEGFHAYAGGPHAERMALAVAGDRARGGCAYVTLEPCNHHGRTPPCVDGLIEAGIARVVVAVRDPNPVAAGGGDRLRQAGIPVEMGLLEEKAREANRYFLHAMETGRPWITLKAGVSLDGRIALANGQSKWITGPKARAQAHRLRALHGAVLVGYRTVLADDPQLTARAKGVRNQPVRIVLDPHGRLTGKERVFDNAAPTWHITGPIDLPSLMSGWHESGIRAVLVEGGSGTYRHFLEANLVDAIELFQSPKILGAGLNWVEGIAREKVPDQAEFGVREVRRLGPDLWLRLRR